MAAIARPSLTAAPPVYQPVYRGGQPVAPAELTAPASPAFVAYRAHGKAWAFPKWLQYVNKRVTEFLLDPGSRFLAIEAPVRHGKSWYGSQAVPVWFLGMFPDRHVLLASYSDTLAKKFGREARDIMAEHGQAMFGPELALSKEAHAASYWQVAGGGSMRSVSLGGTITGTGAQLIILDDLFKDAKEADSKLQRDNVWEWYQRTLRTRLEPGGKIILIMSRWHEDDLTGRLLGSPNFEGDDWERIHLPAIAEPAPWEVEAAANAGTTIDLATWRDVIDRAYGEALWPERWPLEALMRSRAAVGPVGWASNFQQVPVAPGGDTFPRSKWQTATSVSRAGLDLVARIDLAATEKTSGDYTAMGLVGRDKRGNTYVIDVRRGRFSSGDAEEFVRSTAAEWTDTWGDIHFRIEQEPGSAGKTVAQNYIRDVLGGYSAEARPSTKAKYLNAQPLAGQQQAGNVYLLRSTTADGRSVQASWWPDFLEEAAMFPKGSHDDMVDVVANAYNDLFERWQKRKKQKAKVGRPAALAGQRQGWLGPPRGRT